jgi:hypothetical protein
MIKLTTCPISPFFRAALLLAALASAPAFARGKKYDVSGANLRIEVPSGWRADQGLLGAPLTVLGPYKDGARPVVIVSNTVVSESTEFDLKALESSQDDYRRGREAWLSGRNGYSLRFVPFRAEKWPGMKQVVSRGFEYEIGSLHSLETTYYALCGGRLWNFKTVVPVPSSRRPASEPSDEETALAKLLKEATCS